MDYLDAAALRDEFLGSARHVVERVVAERPIGKRLGQWFGRAIGRPAPPVTVSLGIALGSGPGDCGISVRSTAPLGMLEDLLLHRLRARASRLDVRIVEPITPLSSWLGPSNPPLRIGSSVGHPTGGPGTLGAFVRDRGTGRIAMLSNNHVLAAVNQGRQGNDCLHYCASGGPPIQVIGKLERFEKLKDDDNEVDAAIAFVNQPPDSLTDVGGTHRLTGRLVTPTERMEVVKYGRTTGLTNGVVSAAGQARFEVNYDGRICRFNNQIEIESPMAQPFTRKGDSGSLVITPGGDAVGLLFGGTTSRDGIWNLAYVNPIRRVLDLLKVDLLV